MNKEEAIAGLLSQGIPPAELVRQGHARGTVYKVSRRLAKNGSSPHQPDKPVEAGSQTEPGLEDDPEIMELKKALRKAELERQLAEVKGQPALEDRLEALEYLVGELVGDRDDLLAAVKSSPLSGLRSKFKCPCGAKGLVAARVRCTACGRETARGWFPGK